MDRSRPDSAYIPTLSALELPRKGLTILQFIVLLANAELDESCGVCSFTTMKRQNDAFKCFRRALHGGNENVEGEQRAEATPEFT